MFKTHGDTKQRFSFRKSSLGVASVLIASFFLGGGQVMADDFEPASPEVVQVSPDSETVSDQLAETETDTEAPEALATDNKVSDTAETSEVINADKPADFDLSTEKEANPSENSETTVSASLAEPAASKPAVEETAEETDKGESILAIKPAELMASLATGSATRSAESTIYSSTDETATRELRANSERASSRSLTSNRKSFEEINKESVATEREFLRGNFSAIAGDWINGYGEWYRITEDGKATRKLLSDETAVTVDLKGEQNFSYTEPIPVNYLHNKADGSTEFNYIRYAPSGLIFETRHTLTFDYSDRTKARLISRATSELSKPANDVKQFFYRVEDFQSVDYSALNYESEEPLSLETMFNVVNSFKGDHIGDPSRQEMSGIWKNAKGETLLVSPHSTAIKDNGTYFKLLSGFGSSEGNQQLYADFRRKDGSGDSPWAPIFHYFPAGVRFRDTRGEGLITNTTDPTRLNEDRIYLGTDIQNLANHLDDIFYRFEPYPEERGSNEISTQPPAVPTPVPLPDPTPVPVPTSEADKIRQSFVNGDFSALTGIWENGEGDRVLITADGKTVFKSSPAITHQLKRTEFNANMERGAEVSFQGGPLLGGAGGFMGRFAPEGVAFSPGVPSSEVDDSDQSRPRLIFGNGRQASIKDKAYYRIAENYSTDPDWLNFHYPNRDFSAISGEWVNAQGDSITVNSDGTYYSKRSQSTETFKSYLYRDDDPQRVPTGEALYFAGGGPSAANGFGLRYASAGKPFVAGDLANNIFPQIALDDSDTSKERLLFSFPWVQNSIKDTVYYRADKVVTGATNHFPGTKPVVGPAEYSTITSAVLQTSNRRIDLLRENIPNDLANSSKNEIRVKIEGLVNPEQFFVSLGSGNDYLELSYNSAEMQFVYTGDLAKLKSQIKGKKLLTINLHTNIDTDGDGLEDRVEDEKFRNHWHVSPRDLAIFAELAYHKYDDNSKTHFDFNKFEENTFKSPIIKGLNVEKTDRNLFLNWEELEREEHFYSDFVENLGDKLYNVFKNLNWLEKIKYELPAYGEPKSYTTSEKEIKELNNKGMGVKSTARAFINRKDKQAVISFAGTDEKPVEFLLDALIDHAANNDSINPFGPVARRQAGNLIEKIKSVMPDLEHLYITGHSLGGHLAFLAGTHLLDTTISPILRAVYNFNGPGFTHGYMNGMDIEEEANYAAASKATEQGKTIFRRFKTKGWSAPDRFVNSQITFGHAPIDTDVEMKHVKADGVHDTLSYAHFLQPLLADDLFDQGYRTFKDSYKGLSGFDIRRSNSTIVKSIEINNKGISNQPEAARVFRDGNSGVQVVLSHDDTSGTVEVKVEHLQTGSRRTPPVLLNEDYDLFDIELVDQNGQPVDNTHPVRVTLPIDDGKKVSKVFYLPINGQPESLNFARGFDENGRPVVRFTVNHFSHYGVVYEKTDSGIPMPQPNGEDHSLSGVSDNPGSGQPGSDTTPPQPQAPHQPNAGGLRPATNQTVPSGTSGGGSDRGQQTEPVGNTSTELPVGHGGLVAPQPAQWPGESQASLQANPTYTAGQQGYAFASPSATAQAGPAFGAHLLPQTGSAEATSAIFSVLGLISLAGASYGLRSRQEEN